MNKSSSILFVIYAQIEERMRDDDEKIWDMKPTLLIVDDEKTDARRFARPWEER